MPRQPVRLLADPLRKLLRRGASTHAGNMLRKLHAADVARLMDFLDGEQGGEVFSLMLRDAPARAADLISELDADVAVRHFDGLSDRQVANIVSELSSDDAATLFPAMPDELAERVLGLLKESEAAPIEGLLSYEEETAGRIMSPEVFALQEHVPVADAIAALRTSKAEELEMVFYLYVVDDRGHLVGVCSLRDLLLAEPSAPLREVMNNTVTSVSTHTDQEEVARLVARYDFLALPVVDDQNKLVGIITVDDVIDIIRDEETEDILLMAGLGEDEEEVLRAPLWRNALLRLPWLFVAWVGGLIASRIIGQFQGMLAQVVSLAAFIPIIAGMGGNVGSQSATIMVRGLATGRITSGHIGKVVARQVGVGLTLGVLFGILLALITPFLLPGVPLIGVVVGLSIATSMALAASIGTSVPILLRRLGVDPAIATGPFVTTSIDVLGVLAYFLIASILLT
ncbi:MAG: magnesium transporter [Acidobacteriota bacterium]